MSVSSPRPAPELLAPAGSLAMMRNAFAFGLAVLAALALLFFMRGGPVLAPLAVGLGVFLVVGAFWVQLHAVGHAELPVSAQLPVSPTPTSVVDVVTLQVITMWGFCGTYEKSVRLTLNPATQPLAMR